MSTLQDSGPIRASEIAANFGAQGANRFELAAFYAGGLHVPVGARGVNGLVPTVGQISFGNFHGVSSVVDIKLLTPNTQGEFRGFFQTGLGQLTPNHILNGANIISIVKSTVTGAVSVGLTGLLPQDFFHAFYIEGGPTFFTADADHEQSTNTSWAWIDAFGFPGVNYDISFHS